MYYEGNFETGRPSRIYRTVSEIRRDMNIITDKIKESEERINIRELLLELLSGGAESDPKMLIPELYEAITEAKEALSELKTLSEELSDLREELVETRCMFGN